MTMQSTKQLLIPSDVEPAKTAPGGRSTWTSEFSLAEFNKLSVSDRRGFVGNVDGKFVHYCVECGAWGTWGYDCFPEQGRLGNWFCGKHRPAKYAFSEQRGAS